MEEDGGDGRGRASAGQGRERGSCTGKSVASLEPLSSLKRGIGGRPSGAKIRGLWPWPMALVLPSPYPLHVLARMRGLQWKPQGLLFLPRQTEAGDGRQVL